MRSTFDFDAAIAAFRPVIRVWAVAAGVEADDVRQEIAVAVWQGQDPARAVPKALGIRRLGKTWHSTDAAPSAANLDSIEGLGFAAETVEKHQDPVAAGFDGINGTAEIARRAGISRRAAQMRVATQCARAKACGDLFAGVLP